MGLTWPTALKSKPTGTIHRAEHAGITLRAPCTTPSMWKVATCLRTHTPARCRFAYAMQHVKNHAEAIAKGVSACQKSRVIAPVALIVSTAMPPLAHVPSVRRSVDW